MTSSHQISPPSFFVPQVFGQIFTERCERDDTGVFRLQPCPPVRAVRVADVGDGCATVLRRFALDDSRPLAFFAGLWTTWHGKRGTKSNPIEGEHQLFGFLTADANAEVGAIDPKAMPVILTTREEVEKWLTLPAKDALALQRPLQDGTLKIVARGEKEDEAA
jgi:hypothetical protein